MFKKISAVTFFIICFSQFLTAQTGKISGKMIDGDTNGSLPFVNISVKGTDKGTTSDFDGMYSLELDVGTYTLNFSFVGYESKAIQQVVIEDDKTVNLQVTLNPSEGMLDEVMITTTLRRNSEQSVLNMQKNSTILMDGLSLESIKSSGASTIASAVTEVPGVSVQEGKYVYVRGLGDRYTKSILNGMDIPGLDPDKNSIQLDIFPTNILENIIVVKSASADLPADFTGGVVNIVTRDFPSREEFKISVSGTYNPDMHFKDNYLSYDGGGTDFLGFDDGTRKRPISEKANIPNPASTANSTLEGITQSFNPTLAANRETSKPDFSLGLSYGNQYKIGDNKLGFIASLDYKNRTKFYEGFENGIYQKPEENDQFELRFDRRQRGDIGINDVLGSVLAGLSYKTDKSKYKFNVLRLQNGESRAALFNQKTQISNSIDVVKNNLEYTQRSVTNFLLSGKHTNEDATFITEWKLAPTISRSHDKDVRLTTFIQDENGGFSISSDAGFPNRIWRDLEETDLIGKVDLTKKYNLFDNNAQLKFGGFYGHKKRNYGINSYEIAPRAVNTANLNGDPNAILADENVWTPETNSGYYIRGNYQPANTFDATQTTAALYISNEFKIGDRFKSILGVRAEQFNSYFTGQNNSGSKVYDNEETINNLDFFPSANFIYNLQKGMNLRLSYSRTTARPTFKELSVVQITDLLTGTIFLGNLGLKPTYVNNLDFRFEFFGDDAEMFAFSSFYKKFKDPIELVAYSNIAPNQFTPRNAPSAEVLGIELEGRNNFGFISEGLKNLGVKVNVSIMESRIKMNKGENQEFESRKLFAKPGKKVEDTRQLQGQSPYLVNAGINYQNSDIGLETGLYYNVQGKTLDVVGFGKNPDVFVQPFNNLNFNFSKKLGKEGRSTIGLKVENILGDDRESLYDSYKSSSKRFKFRSPGTAFKISYSLSL